MASLRVVSLDAGDENSLPPIRRHCSINNIFKPKKKYISLRVMSSYLVYEAKSILLVVS